MPTPRAMALPTGWNTRSDSNPLQANVTQLPTAALQTTGGSTYLTMKYRQLIGQTALDYNVGVSGDLQARDWTENQIEQLGPPVTTGGRRDRGGDGAPSDADRRADEEVPGVTGGSVAVGVA